MTSFSRKISFFREENDMELNIGEYNWSPSIDKILRRWQDDIRRRKGVCISKIKFYRVLHYLIGLPACICIAIVSTGIFSTFQSINNNDCASSSWVLLAMGIIGIIGTILFSIQTFTNFQGLAESFKATSSGYEGISREIDSILAIPVNMRGNAIEVINHIRSRYDDLVVSSPDVIIVDEPISHTITARPPPPPDEIDIVVHTQSEDVDLDGLNALVENKKDTVVVSS